MKAKQCQAKAKQLALALTRSKSTGFCSHQLQGYGWCPAPIFKGLLCFLLYVLCSNVRFILYPYTMLLFVVMYQFKNLLTNTIDNKFQCKTDSTLAKVQRDKFNP